METLSYMGLPDCIRLSNGAVDVIVTTAVGPRILFYGPTNGENLLAHFPDSSKETALGTWKPYGGHRLWVWPEVFPATYAPDNGPIEHRREGELGIVLSQPTDAAGMQKVMRIQLAASGTEVELVHTITSHNLWPVDIAAWAITVVQSGTAIVPRVPFRTHDEYVPATQPLALCAFTDLQDPRFTLGLKYILLRADPNLPNSQKFGLRNKENWCAHLVKDTLFVKRFSHDDTATYPDYDVNNEVYVEGSFMEVELLGPRRIVSPGDSLTLSEKWNLFERVGVGGETKDLDSLDRAITPKIRSLF
ncbi:hypothetical protein ACPOL_0996 [Acidisarcina polymorpha]|uniref:Uncharacterized protein n=1 Tax=Acidisarcina polymorpha TaxID=2211140 RepID=A0A2Z5FV07_9BACT|nr:hypothetical protein [Acidisarcina polymorpha]AXC10347.1 hypothetical protein ACPOL_0996 [Acidisarcina polymorpha]